MAIMTRWHMPPDNSMRIGRQPRLRIADAHRPQQLERLGAGGSLRQRPCAASTSTICRSTVRIGFNAARGFWKIIDTRRPRNRRRSAWAASVMSRPSKRMRPPVMRPARSQQAHHRKRRDGLARAAFAHDAQGLAALQGDVDAVQRLHDAMSRREGDLQVLDLQERLSCAHARIEDVAQSVAQQVEAENRQHQRQRRGRPPATTCRW